MKLQINFVMAHAVNDSNTTHYLSMAMKLQETYLNADGHVATREKELLRGVGSQALDFLREGQCLHVEEKMTSFLVRREKICKHNHSDTLSRTVPVCRCLS